MNHPTDPCTLYKTAEDLPQKPLARMAVKLYLLGSLAWDYADTCCNIAATMKLNETKPVSRAVRNIKREYDRFRNRSMRDADLALESNLGLLFEEICEAHFSRLNYGISSDKKLSGMSPDFMMLIKAVHMAMAVIDTMKLYAAECDSWIRSQGVVAQSIMSDHFSSLAILLPEFAGDCYEPCPEARKTTARILLTEIKRIEINDKSQEVCK